MKKILFLGLGSVLGGYARYFLSVTIDKNTGSAFPFGTLAVNAAGCFLIGCLSAIAKERFWLGDEGRLLLMTGFCGAFTTFSTFMLETEQLSVSHNWMQPIGYVAISLIGGWAAFKIGLTLGQLV